MVIVELEFHPQILPYLELLFADDEFLTNRPVSLCAAGAV